MAAPGRSSSSGVLRWRIAMLSSVWLASSASFATDFVVTSPADVVAADGVVTLREAIAAANTDTAVFDAPAGAGDGDRIRFDPTVFGPGLAQTIALSGTALSIEDDLLIQGVDAATGNTDLEITIDAGGASRVFVIDTVGFAGAARNVTIGGPDDRERQRGRRRRAAIC